ncbi:MAG: hypothetical protein [Bacteriophage sp.]|nr:MAG: hypothetical protein [Bacteriophage sp.]
MADISTTNKKARVPILGENGRISDAYIPQAVIDAEASSKTYAENAKSYSELVKKDAESAASSATSAKESADAASEGISSIDEKVTQAGQFAEAASSSATEANNYLQQVTTVSDTVSGIASSVAENAQTAETFANKSKESAASALTASTNAVNAKVDAEGYRDSAKSYSDNAKADADTAKNILESVKAQKADVDSTVQQFNVDATEYDTKFNGYVSEAKESKEASAASAISASESAENASTSATNASASEAKAKTSADAAALSATNAATSAKEAADNLSLLGASTLTRKEKDTFIHVDDAFPSSLLGIDVEGACRQDGTPSPDNPVPIQVVENPVFKVTGRNLLDFSFPAYRAVYSSSVAYIKYSYKEAALPFTTENSSANGFGFVLKLKPGTYTLRAFNTPAKAVVAIAMYAEESKIYSYANKISYMKEKVLTAPISFTVSEGAEYVVICLAAEWGDGHNKITYPADFKVTVEYGTTASDYAPYTSQSQAFTLPAEHPYLAKIGDVADEIKVDRDGNVSLIANVGKYTVDTVPYAQDEVNNFGIQLGMHGASDRYLCAYLSDRHTIYDHSADWLTLHKSDVTFTTVDEAKQFLKGKVFFYQAKEPKTYPLGKITLPALPESVSNVWTDAEITPKTGIEYTRDVNIVVANLESAIASIS